MQRGGWLRAAPNDSAASIQSFGPVTEAAQSGGSEQVVYGSVELVVDSGGGGGALTCSVLDTKVFSRRLGVFPPPTSTFHKPLNPLGSSQMFSRRTPPACIPGSAPAALSLSVSRRRRVHASPRRCE